MWSAARDSYREQTIRSSFADRSYIDGGKPVLPAPAALSSPVRELPEPLTPREREVLQMISAGLGNKEIAGRLSISDHTVKFHVASILGKLGASSRTEAVSNGIRHGLVLL